MTSIQAAPVSHAIGVSLRGVSRTFAGNVAAVSPFDLHVSPGQFIALLGPSGCGKSTLLRLIAGLDRPTAGSIALDPGDGDARGALAYVFQDAHLLPWRRVLANVTLPLELRRVGTSAQRRAAAVQALQDVGLADAADRYPAQLSGGMRMRVSLARALVTRPRLLLMDEPFAALDEITRQELDDQLRQLWRSAAMTVLFVTHSISEATFLAQRAVVLTPRPARVALDHAIDLPAQREASLRGTPEFAHHNGVLLQALRRGAEGGTQ